MNIDLSTARSFLSRLAYGKRLRPSRDWFVLVSLTLLAIAGFAVWSVWIYLGGAQASQSEAVPLLVPTLSPEALEETERMFERRAAERVRYESEYEFVDPSRLAR